MHALDNKSSSRSFKGDVYLLNPTSKSASSGYPSTKFNAVPGTLPDSFISVLPFITSTIFKYPICQHKVQIVEVDLPWPSDFERAYRSNLIRAIKRLATCTFTMIFN